MAVTRIHKFSDINEAEIFLNGGLILGELAGAPGGLAGGIYGLVGKTLKFTSPAVHTVTFVGSTPSTNNPDAAVLGLADIKAQIEAVMTTLLVRSFGRRLVLIEATPSAGVTIDKTGTSNAILGAFTGADMVGKVYAPPPSATPPCWVWASVDGNNAHVLYTLE